MPSRNSGQSKKTTNTSNIAAAAKPLISDPEHRTTHSEKGACLHFQKGEQLTAPKPASGSGRRRPDQAEPANTIEPRRSARVAAAALLKKETEQQAQRTGVQGPGQARVKSRAKSLPKKSAAKKKTQNRKEARVPESVPDQQTHKRAARNVDRGVQTENRKEPGPGQERNSTPTYIGSIHSTPLVQPWLHAVAEAGPLKDPESDDSERSIPYQDMPPKRTRSGNLLQQDGLTLDPSGNEVSSRGSRMTVEKIKKRVDIKSMLSSLKARGIEVDAMKDLEQDKLLDGFRAKMASDMETPATNFNEIRNQLQNFLDATKTLEEPSTLGSIRHQKLEDLMHGLNKTLPLCNIFTLTEADMQTDVCKSNEIQANEYVLQRTAMMSSLDRWRLGESIFTFDCERVWSQAGANSLPLPLLGLRNVDSLQTMSRPMPDLCLYFKLESIMKRWPKQSEGCVPDDLNTCIHPDGILDQCFPFLFVEAKSGITSLHKAHVRNLYSASHALYNIFRCMKRAQGQDRNSDVKGYEKLRIFSIGLNAERFVLRAHRISFDAMKQIHFDHQIITETLQRGHAMSKVVRCLLDAYVSETLFPLLRKLYRDLTRPNLISAFGVDTVAEAVRTLQAQPLPQCQAYDSRYLDSPAMSVVAGEERSSSASQSRGRRPSQEEQRPGSSKRHKGAQDSDVAIVDNTAEAPTVPSSGVSANLTELAVERQDYGQEHGQDQGQDHGQD